MAVVLLLVCHDIRNVSKTITDGQPCPEIVRSGMHLASFGKRKCLQRDGTPVVPFESIGTDRTSFQKFRQCVAPRNPTANQNPFGKGKNNLAISHRHLCVQRPLISLLLRVAIVITKRPAESIDELRAAL